MPLTVLLEKTPESPLESKEIKPVNLKGNQPWILFGRTDAESFADSLATWCKEPTHWKSPWCWERLRAEGEEGSIRGWDGWMALPMQWRWTWTNSGRWWGTGRPGKLQSMGHKESDTTGRLNNNNNNAWLLSLWVYMRFHIMLFIVTQILERIMTVIGERIIYYLYY